MMHDPTLNGIKDPAMKLLRLKDSRENLHAQIREKEDQIEIITCEIQELEIVMKR